MHYHFFWVGRKMAERDRNPGVNLIFFFFLEEYFRICDDWLPREERLGGAGGRLLGFISALSVLFVFLTTYLYYFYAFECQQGLSRPWDCRSFSFLLYALSVVRKSIFINTI